MQGMRGPVLCSLVVFLGGGGCVSADGVEQPEEPQEVRAEGEPVSFDPVEEVRSFMSGIPDRRRLLIDEPEEWAGFWAELNANLVPTPDLPSVNFDSHVVIAATMGRKPTGGYAIRIEEVRRTGDDLRVVVAETSPGAGCITIQAFTAPATAVTVPRPVGELEFVERTETEDCL
jgi:hypothetical protein